MNDSQLPAEISPKHSRTQGEVDETGKSEVEEGKSGENTQARDLVVLMKKEIHAPNITLHEICKVIIGM